MKIIGVDPGKTGYVTKYDDTLKTYSFFQIPVKDDRLDSLSFYSKFCNEDEDCFIYQDEFIIYAEQIHSLFGMSAKSNFSFGGIFYSILAVLDMFGEVNLIQPKEWQKEMHKGIEKNEDKKVMSLQAAQKLFPDMDFKRTPRCTTPDHNLIDSLLICEYGKRKYYEANK